MAADFEAIEKIIQKYVQAGYSHVRVRSGEQEIEISDLHATTNQAQSADVQATDTVLVTSPMVGIFHPTEGLKTGSQIKKGQELGQLESMKLFNPVVSPVTGTMIRMTVKQVKPVEFQELLFEIRREG